MKYNISIDMISSIEWKLNQSEAIVFAWLYTLPSWADSLIISWEIYYFWAKTKAITELPMITDKVDTMYRIYKDLEKKWLIKIQKVDTKDFIKLTEKSKIWNTIRDSDLNPTELGKKSESSSEKNPTYNNTNINNNTIYKEEETTFKKISNFENSSFLENQKEKENWDFSKENEKESFWLSVPADLTNEKDYFIKDNWEKIFDFFNWIYKEINQIFIKFLNERKKYNKKLKWSDIAINKQKSTIADLILKYDEKTIYQIIENCIIRQYDNICDLWNKITIKTEETWEIQEIKETIKKLNWNCIDKHTSEDLKNLLENLKENDYFKNSNQDIKEFLENIINLLKNSWNTYYGSMAWNPKQMNNNLAWICNFVFNDFKKKNDSTNSVWYL